MQLIALGTGSALPTANNNAPAFLLASTQSAILLDCGSGTLHRLACAQIPLHNIAAIFISHFHIDHCADLPAILFAMRHTPTPRTVDLHIYAGPGLLQHLNALFDLYQPQLTTKDWQILPHCITNQTFQVDDLICRTKTLTHHPSSLGIRIQDPNLNTFAYLGDTDLCPNAIDLCRNADLALVECAVTDQYTRDAHLAPHKIADLARQAQPHALLITHLFPETSPERVAQELQLHQCPTPFRFAYDGMGVDFIQPNTDPH